MSDLLKGRVYIVTGGSRGFGRAIAESLVAAGAQVGLLGRSEKALDEVVELLGSSAALAHVCDVADAAGLQRAFDAVRSHFGRFDGLVNNAGMARPDRIENLVETEVVQQVHTNFIGTVLACQAAIPRLREADNPRIVNISSASAWHYDEMAHLSIYAATKAAVERFTRDLREEVQVDSIGVSCIRPGGAITGFADEWDADKLGAAMRDWKDAGTYMDMGMEPAHVGNAVCTVLAQPRGVAVDLLEIRPNTLTPKSIF